MDQCRLKRIIAKLLNWILASLAGQRTRGHVTAIGVTLLVEIHEACQDAILER
jgi:hypothetical protein